MFRVTKEAPSTLVSAADRNAGCSKRLLDPGSDVSRNT